MSRCRNNVFLDFTDVCSSVRVVLLKKSDSYFKVVCATAQIRTGSLSKVTLAAVAGLHLFDINVTVRLCDLKSGVCPLKV
jgi:hypothetical protein